MDLVQLLFKIDNNLGKEDFESLKFLCVDLIPYKKMERFLSCLDLFVELQKSDDLSEESCFILAELLYLIGQYNLLKLLDTNKDAMKKALQEKRCVSMYRRMLYELSESITTEDLRVITFLLQIPNKFKDNKSFLEILCYLDKTEIISEDNLEVLEKVMQNVSPELLQKIKKYKQYKELLEVVTPSAPTGNFNSSLTDPPLSIQAVSSTGMAFQDDEMESIREHIEEVQEYPSEKDVETENDMSALSLQDQTQSKVYPMNQKHRGYCVIINNSVFAKSEPRPGTEKDAEYLKHVFTWLGFDIKVYSEQNKQQICDIMKKFSMKDHADRDCFVCCILSHGESQVVFGADNEVVHINDMVSDFSTNCKTLAGKPKLFFIQACQGKTQHGAHLIEEDASIKTIPDYADVLIGMSTVDGYYSYRHTEMGTWYIQALCLNLIRMVPNGEDILSILTKVNKDVSEKEYRKSQNILKQMPQPMYTLRMKLVFPIPTTKIDEFV
ncbi:caspase-8-like [Mantella aurantiaca]